MAKRQEPRMQWELLYLLFPIALLFRRGRR